MNSTSIVCGPILLPSMFQPGDDIQLHPAIGRATGRVKAVRFTSRKVSYDIKLDVGGKTLREVDSEFVTPLMAN